MHFLKRVQQATYRRFKEDWVLSGKKVCQVHGLLI